MLKLYKQNLTFSIGEYIVKNTMVGVRVFCEGGGGFEIQERKNQG